MRIVLRFKEEPRDRVEVNAVRLLSFGEDDPVFSRSINGCEKTTWYTSFTWSDAEIRDAEENDPIGILTPDSVLEKVYYIAFEGDAHVAMKDRNRGVCVSNMIEHDTRVLEASHFDAMEASRQNVKSVAGKVLSNVSREDVVRCAFEDDLLPKFTKLLRTPLPGFDVNGRRVDGTSEDHVFLEEYMVNERFDAESSSVFISHARRRICSPE